MTFAEILKDSNYKINQFNLPEIEESEDLLESAKQAMEEEEEEEEGEERGMKVIENFSKS